MSLVSNACSTAVLSSEFIVAGTSRSEYISDIFCVTGRLRLCTRIRRSPVKKIKINKFNGRVYLLLQPLRHWLLRTSAVGWGVEKCGLYEDVGAGEVLLLVCELAREGFILFRVQGLGFRSRVWARTRAFKPLSCSRNFQKSAPSADYSHYESLHTEDFRHFENTVDDFWKRSVKSL
jgi:hypothetical protein